MNLLHGIFLLIFAVREIHGNHEDFLFPDRTERRIDGKNRRCDQLRLRFLIKRTRLLVLQQQPFQQRQVARIQHLILIQICERPVFRQLNLPRLHEIIPQHDGIRNTELLVAVKVSVIPEQQPFRTCGSRQPGKRHPCQEGSRSRQSGQQPACLFC